MLAAEGRRQDLGCRGLSPSIQSRRESWASVASGRRDSRVLQNDLLLHEAVIKNEAETVEKILKEPVDVNSRNNYGRAPIHWASSRGSTEVMKMLIDANCDVEAQDRYGMRPVHMAAWHGHRDAVALLVDSGVNVAAVNKKGFTLLICAAKNNRVDVMSFLEERLSDLRVNDADVDGQTALHHAAERGHLDAVVKLFEMGARIDCADKANRTPLHRAAEKGHAEVTELLLRRGASANARDEDGNVPLHLSTENRQTRATQALLEHGNLPDVPNGEGLTALHLASGMGCRGITESLLLHGSDVNALTKSGDSPLHLACRINEASLVELLISKGADVNRLNFRLESPIQIAAENGFREVCQLLLAAGANSQDNEQGGKVSLHVAARGSLAAIVDVIVRTAGLELSAVGENSQERAVNRTSTKIEAKVSKKLGKDRRRLDCDRLPRSRGERLRGPSCETTGGRPDEGERKATNRAFAGERTGPFGPRCAGSPGKTSGESVNDVESVHKLNRSDGWSCLIL